MSVLFSIPTLLVFAVLNSAMVSQVNTSTSAKTQLTETDLSQISINDVTLGMDKAQVEALLQQHFSTSKQSDSASIAAFKCIKRQCQAQQAGAAGSTLLDIHFNAHLQVYWISMETQAQLGGTPEECLTLGGEQLDGLRQQYSPNNQQHFYGPHSVSLRLNKQGHPDPADNSFFGYRVQIKCDPFAKGVAQSEFELRDDSLSTPN